MTSKISLLFVCVLAATCINEGLTESAPSLEQAYKTLLESMQTAGKTIKELIVIPDEIEKDKVYQSLKASIQKTVDSAGEALKKIEKEIGRMMGEYQIHKLIDKAKPYTEEAQKSYTAALKQLNDTLKQLKDKETQAKLEKLYETYTASLKKLAEQSSDLGKSLGITVPDKLQSAAHDLIEEISKMSQKVQAKIASAIKSK